MSNNTNFEQLRDCIYHAHGKLLNTYIAPGQIIRLYSVNAKTILLHTWEEKGNVEGVITYRELQPENDMKKELQALDEYINS